MQNIWKWILGIVVVLAVLFALPFVYNNLFGYGYYGMMGSNTWNHPMMGGTSYSPFGGFAMGLGMILAWGIPLGLLLLAIYGVTQLTGKQSQPASPASEKICSKCGKASQWDWNTCPYCGEPL